MPGGTALVIKLNMCVAKAIVWESDVIKTALVLQVALRTDNWRVQRRQLEVRISLDIRCIGIKNPIKHASSGERGRVTKTLPKQVLV